MAFMFSNESLRMAYIEFSQRERERKREREREREKEKELRYYHMSVDKMFYI